MTSLVGAGVAFGAAILSKYTGAFTLGVIGFAYLLAPAGRQALKPVTAWVAWALRGIVPIVVGLATFFALDPLVLRLPGQVPCGRQGANHRPADRGHETDLDRQLRGPADTGALLVYKPSAVGPRPVAGAPRPCRHRVAADAPGQARGGGRGLPDHLFPGRGPLDRAVHPLCDSAGARAGADGRHAERRVAAPAAGRVRSLDSPSAATVVTTFVYALAFMNVYRQPDARLQASQWLLENAPPDSKILVEPSQNTPPIGSYLTATDFYRDYVLWGGTTLREAQHERRDYYHLFTFDVYRYLYADRYPTTRSGVTSRPGWPWRTGS